MVIGRAVLSAGVFLAALAFLTSCAKPAPSAGVSAEGKAVGVEFVQKMTTGAYADAVAHFDTVMKKAMSAEQLKQTWESIVGQCGAFKKTGPARTANQAGFDIVFVPCEFEKATLDTKIVLDKDGKIGGLWFVPHVDAADAEYSTPDYVQKDRFDEREVTVGTGEWKLPGTLTVPKGAGPFPAVVLVHGSGPNDRDETIGANKPFRDLAEGLASRGVVVLRYDKRTKVYPAKVVKEPSFTVKEEAIDDVVAAVTLLRNTKEVNSKKIFALGHSLGGMLIPRIGKADPRIAGLIVMAGATRPLEDIILEQTIYLVSLNGTPSPEAQKKIDEVRDMVAKVKSPDLSPNSPPMFSAPATYWLDLRGYKPAEAAKSLKQPMLIMQGGRDYQSTTAEYDGWTKALAGRPNVTFKLYPTLNHLFAEGEGKSTPQEYEKRGPVSKAVIDDLVGWIKAR